jgi:hypothetical protein
VTDNRALILHHLSSVKRLAAEKPLSKLPIGDD